MSFEQTGRGCLVIISAPSGTGKTTVIQRLLEKNQRMVHSVSCTTRARRPQETDGKDYHFLSVEEFQKGIRENRFAEWAEVHGSFYGTPKEPIERWLSAGVTVLLPIDVQGGMNLKNLYPRAAISIFLLPPSEEELKRRLDQRKTDSKAEKEIRLQNAKKEMKFKDAYDHQVVNREVEEACLAIEELIRKG
ncbi:MAG: guanylate kinase [Deltaproteobacteria bacterium]|nr:guanylate kinase [Deltaproteobacteria bacterium]